MYRISSEPISTQLRVKFLLTGVLLPILCFVLAAVEQGAATVNTPWQSGQLVHFVAMLLRWPGFGPFLPLVLLSAICMSVWLVKQQASQHAVIRLGIESGAILALQFLIMVTITSGAFTFFIAAFVAPAIAGVVFVLHAITTRVHRFTIRHLLILTTAVAVSIVSIQIVGAPNLWESIIAGLFFASAATPTLCLVTYVRAGYHVVHQSHRPDIRAFAVARWIAWIMAWLASWKFAVDIMLDEYSNLPVTDPNCYVSSAAAGGHEWLVGRCDNKNGRKLVNDQMRWLKFLELALIAAFPRIHRRLRSLYDRVGPPLADRCRRNVWIADVSYLLLKPLECVSRIIRLLAGVPSATVLAIYDQPPR